jgi:hypothetical protein
MSGLARSGRKTEREALRKAPSFNKDAVDLWLEFDAIHITAI